MRTHSIVIVLLALVLLAASSRAGSASPDGTGLVYRYYAGIGYRVNPLLSFGRLNDLVSRQDKAGSCRLAHTLIERGSWRGDALYWTYDFPFAGASAGWTSGFAQAVAAQALARTARLTGDLTALAAARGAFQALRERLLIAAGGGAWIREYSFTGQLILNAQLESMLALEWYARIVGGAAVPVAAAVERAALNLLPRFDLGDWGRYQLGGPAADRAYQGYHVDLLRRIAERHREPIWRATYLRWRRGLEGSRS
jgi:D-glucuronyl C5-epimerase-like protein